MPHNRPRGRHPRARPGMTWWVEWMARSVVLWALWPGGASSGRTPFALWNAIRAAQPPSQSSPAGSTRGPTQCAGGRCCIEWIPGRARDDVVGGRMARWVGAGPR